MRNKRLLVTGLKSGLLLFSITGWGQLMAQVVKGTITGRDGLLPGATISSSNGSKSTTTNLDGTFTFLLPSLGKQTITVSYVGYLKKQMEIVVSKGVNDAGTIELSPDNTGPSSILVRGTMAPSQIKAYSIKRNSVAIMDVIAADAIGKLPDRNAAEAVQRMQGVAVARYHGEADQATVRGTPFAWTSTMFNGSRLPSSNVLGNRSSVLDAVPSEMIQYVQVAKALTPDWEGDAIGGSINFITRTAPAKRQLNASLAGGYNSFSQNGTYNASLVYGDRFFNNKLGVMLAGAIWDRQWGTDSYEIAYNTGLSDATQQKSISTALLKRYMGKRQTYGGNLGLEYKFNAAHKITFRGLMDKFNDIRPVYESYVDYNNSRYQYNYRYSYYQTKLNGAELGGEHQLSSKIKLDWSVSDYLSKYYLKTPGTSENNGLPIATFRQKITGGFNNLSSDGKRYWGFDSPNGVGGEALSFEPGIADKSEVMDASKLTLQQLVVSQLDTKERDKTAQVNVKFNINSRLSIKAGGKFRHKYRSSLYGSNFVYIATGSAPLQTLSSLQTTDKPGGETFFKNMGGHYNQYVMNPLTKQQLFDQFSAGSLSQNGFANYTSATNATNPYTGTEDVTAGYVMAEYDATSQLKIIGGVRNEYTNMTLNGNKANTTSSGTTIEAATVKSNYNALLPMLHFKYALNDKANIRAAYTRTFIRANFSDLTPGQSVNSTSSVIAITKGNPDLKPTFSNNFDLMAEYYFNNIGMLSGGVFYKQLSNLIFSNTTAYIQDGTNYTVTQANNLDNAHLYGVEAGINKRFDFLKGFWSGFGVEVNGSYIQSEVNIPRTTSTITDKSSLPNQSKVLFNTILFYERKGVMVRLAGNYRGKSVETINQKLGKDFYIWTDKNFTVDASATVTLTKSLKVFAELNNLTNQPLKTYMGDQRRIATAEWYGIRGQAGIRWDIIH
ncbi:TonB-dependent receptor [Filimonas lacunae]|uniref:TonB-dependent receptor n=1 Tax=Filimonas lacunae TaxID=477680 RepID=A0A173MDP6_9BACT|nr:TonB-dependent receptor [Filimonas lacunae]BAV05650.1 TonB-dependent receptor [Filimonas lacunae]SIT29049.1 TonB-dependent receptor [Filimonas lacunae]